MKVARFRHNDEIKYGIVDDDALVVLAGDPMFAGYDTTGERVLIGDATLLAPVIPRSKIVCFGKNYLDHIREMGWRVTGEPVMFLKPNTAVVGPGDPIVIPRGVDRVQPEGEIAVVMGKIAKNVPAQLAEEFVFGYTIANDVSARGYQETDMQWARAKGFDSFCPLGPVIETEPIDPDCTIRTTVNGEVVQYGSGADMITSVASLIEYASHVFTLLPGDVILTGSPAGLRDLAGGDHVDIEISGIGTLTNPVVQA